MRLRRQVQIAVRKRHEVWTVPSSSTTWTGPSTRIGPSRSTVTRRGRSGVLGTDDHQLFPVVVAGQQPLVAQPPPACAQHGPERDDGAVGDGGVEPGVGEPPQGRGGPAEGRM